MTGRVLPTVMVRHGVRDPSIHDVSKELAHKEEGNQMTETINAAPSRADAAMDLLYKAFMAEIRRRGGETSLGGRRDKDLEITDIAGELTVLHVEGWRKYTSQESHHAQTSYLCGFEDGQVWAVRVPGSIISVAGALSWVTPAAVKRAVEKGKRVQRQGDVYAIETTKVHDGKGRWALGLRHEFNSETRQLTHPEHRALHLPYPVRFVAQKALGMGRGWGTASVRAD